MGIAVKNLNLYQGDTHIFKVSLFSDGLPLNLSGSNIVMQIKPDNGSEFISPKITLNGEVAVIHFPSLLTHDVSWRSGSYDIRQINGSIVKTLLRGRVIIEPSVTPVKESIGQGGSVREERIEVEVSGQAVIVRNGGANADANALRLEIQELRQTIASIPAGEKGADGMPGERGLDGRAATVEIGTVSVGQEASVTNSGNQSAAVLNFVIPKGEKGERGLPGQAGTDGRPGEKGENGLSAYDIAVKNGFQGSEQEWLQSLKKPAGNEAYALLQEGYYGREDLQRFSGDSPIANGKFITVPWPKPFSERPFVQITADVVSKSTRIVYVQNITETGFNLACNYAADLKGVWYRAYIKSIN